MVDVSEAGRDICSALASGSWSPCLSRGWTAVRLAVKNLIGLELTNFCGEGSRVQYGVATRLQG